MLRRIAISHRPALARMLSNGGKAADFGRRKVDTEVRTGLIKNIFNYNASKYDLVGSIFALGLHTGWKRELARRMGKIGSLEGIYEKIANGKYQHRKIDILDTCGGTGDLTLHILDYAAATRYYRTKREMPVNLKVVDMSPQMMEIGQAKAKEKGYVGPYLSWNEGNVEALEEPDCSQDFYMSSFGLRNISNRIKSLQEAHRVLRKGGKILALEMSHVQIPVLREVYESIVLKGLPVIGRLITRETQMHEYFIQSIKDFPDQEKLTELFKEAGFKQCRYTNLCGGVVAIHEGIKL